MKKNIASALIGTSFFALPYLALSVAVWPSVLIGTAAFGASELLFSNTGKKIIQSIKDKPIKEILGDAKIQNEYLFSTIDKIEDENTQKNLSEIYKTVNSIIETVNKYPNKIKSVYNFFDYYLPVLVKIVSRYDNIEDQKLSSKEGKAFIKSVGKMVEEANISFKKVLANLYQEDIVDADAEMKVFNTMLKNDGLNNDLEVKEKENE